MGTGAIGGFSPGLRKGAVRLLPRARGMMAALWYGTFLRSRSSSDKQQMMISEISEINALSRTLVEASMGAAQTASEQRERVVTVVRMEERIRQAATRSLANSKAAAEQTQLVAEEIDSGTETIAVTNRTMVEMVESVTAGADLMDEFVERMAEVNKIVGEISGIARQTNLLALNAAIEAAHAGDEGEGFSVIAHEIRILADRASRATREIVVTIGKMTESAATAGKSMQIGRNAATTSIEENVRVQRSLESMRSGIHNLLALSASVAKASEEQIAAGSEVTTCVMGVDQVVAGASLDADSAAEMSIKMVLAAEKVNATLQGWSEKEAASRNKGRRATDRVLRQVTDQRPAVLDALRMLRETCATAGPPIMHGTMHVHGETLPGLYFGGQPATEVMPWVDAIFLKTGCGATIFVLSNGQFVRVATTMKLFTGERAVGTRLNEKGLAMSALRQAMSYVGAVYVLGNPLVAAYEPLFSQQGKVVGALYVGLALQREYFGEKKSL